MIAIGRAVVRDLSLPQDLACCHRINEQGVPGVNSLTVQALRFLVERSLFSLVVGDRGGEAMGFVICLGEGVDYDSPNYRWFSTRHASFAYVDRVALSPQVHGRGMAGELYETLMMRLTGIRPVLCCEVNTRPANPASMRFHQRMGFEPVGNERLSAQKAVVYLERAIPGA